MTIDFRSKPKDANGHEIVAATEAVYDGSSQWEGASFVAAGSSTTDFDYKVETSSKLFEGTFHADHNAQPGDYVEFCVVDVDGVLPGVPPGTVLKKYVTKLYVVASERRKLRSGQSASIPAGVYLRTSYTATGTDSVRVSLDWLFVR